MTLAAPIRRSAAVLVHANVVIASAATGVAVTTAVVARLPLEALPLLFVFVATWFAYTANRFTDRDEDRRNLPGRTRFVDRYGRRLLGLGAMLYLALLAVVAIVEPWMLPPALLPGIAIAVYSTGAASRSFLVKNGLVGLLWAAIPLGLGTYYGQLSDQAVLASAGCIFVFIGAAAAIFDIKDIEGDRAVGSRTLPVTVGPARTRQLALMAVASLVPLIAVTALFVTFRFAIFGVYAAYLLVAFPFATPDRGPLYYGLIVDGEHVLVGTLALVFRIAF